MTRHIALALALFSLAACGGSGGGVATPPPGPPPMGGGGPMPFPAAPNDPLLASQWHLVNTGQGGGTAAEDCRATQVWANAAGNNPELPTAGIVVAVLDDGLELAHEDLAPNVATSLHSNFAGGVDPSPRTDIAEQSHGTACAGVIAGRGNNGLGVTGVAPYAQLVGRRLLDAGGGGTDAQFQSALLTDINQIHVVNSSFGPNDDGMYYAVSQPDWDTYVTGIATGRSNRGAIYVRAAGNGGGAPADDFANLDELNSHYAVIAVTAVGNDGQVSGYSERGSSILLAGHSNGGSLAIQTTDQTGAVGYDATNYTNTFGGTSSATPLVSGVVALMLSTNANLGWRDVRRILAQSARQVNPGDAGWVNNGAGMSIHPFYGHGAADALAATTMATGWVNLPALQQFGSPADNVGAPVPEDAGVTGITRTIVVAAGALPQNEVDHVIVELNLTSANVRELRVTLTSPQGTVSDLLRESNANVAATPGGTMRLGSTRCMRENPTGTWTLTVQDFNNAGNLATFTSWQLRLYGQ